jgi:hypothetical protein
MELTYSHFESLVEEFGELFIVLDSGEEYEIHGNRGFTVRGDHIEIEGMKSDGEYGVVIFSLDDVEHVWSHREV